MTLPTKHLEPNGFTWASFKNADGQEMRYGHIKPKGDIKSHIILAPGYGEPIEKFFETIRELNDAGHAVWAMDWRGQGASARVNGQLPHGGADMMEDHISDLKQLTEIVEKAKAAEKDTKPLAYMGFSMGGHIGMRFMHDNPDVFDHAVINAGMFDFQTGGIPRGSVPLIARFMCASGKSQDLVPKGSLWTPAKEVFKGNNKTSDPERFKVLGYWFENNPILQMSSQTYEWILGADKSIKTLNQKKYLEEIKTPILMMTPMADTIVSVKAQQNAAKILPNAKLIEIEGAAHEIAMEQDQYRQGWIKNAIEFFDASLKKNLKPSSKMGRKKQPNPKTP